MKREIKRHPVMVKFNEGEFELVKSYQEEKLKNCHLLNPPALKLSYGDAVRMIINDYFLIRKLGTEE